MRCSSLVRSSSLPPARWLQDVVANPWWSQKARMEQTLSAMRPKDLPSGVIDLEGGSPGAGRAVKDRDDGRGRSSSPSAKENASGATGFGSPEEGGPEPRLFAGHPQKRLQGSAGEQDPNGRGATSSLDRELEVGMVNYLRCQNQELREEVERLTKRIKTHQGW